MSFDYSADLIAINALMREIQHFLDLGETRHAKVALAGVINSAANVSAWCRWEEARIEEARAKRAKAINHELITVGV